MRTIAIINQKGGSGKTTTAINLSASLARRGHRVLLVDVDPQSHCALGLAIPESHVEVNVGDVMLAPESRRVAPESALWRVSKGLDLLPSSTRLAALEAARGGLAEREDRDRRLLESLRPFADEYDWCLIDCPPFIGLLTFNALRAADEVLIPVETGYFALEGATIRRPDRGPRGDPRPSRLGRLRHVEGPRLQRCRRQIDVRQPARDHLDAARGP